MTDYTVIYTSIISSITEVRLYEETITHIKESHGDDFARSPEFPFPCILDAVGNAIMNPTQVELSYGNSFVYVDETSTSLAGPLRVPVKLVSGTSGRVKSFYFATPSGPRAIIWRKS